MQTVVIDRFEIKPDMVGSDHAPGLIVVFDGAACGADHWPSLGTQITIHTRGGETTSFVGELKTHGNGVSLFFAGLNSELVPVGSIIEWSDKPVEVYQTSKV